MFRSSLSMSRLLFLTLAVLLTAILLPVTAQAQQCWDLVWSDEFNGPNIDLSKWEFEVNGWGGGNNELQYYTDRTENAQIINGALHIIGRQETYTGPDGTRNYTSARLRTIFQGDWKYGRFEASIKLPTGQGMWPAFWMLPTDWVYGGWPLSGEIDIMENVGFEPDIVHGTLHYGDAWPNNSYTGASINVSNSSTQFHTYAVEWEENEIRWYVDGVHYSTKTPADLNPKPWPFDQRFHLLLNLAIGGNWPGSPDGSTVFPQHYEIDYVRVYQGINSYGIDGDDTVFEGDTGKVYSMTDVAGATYTWSVPAGATITSGQGTHSITVDWGTTSGDVEVNFSNGCAARTYTRSVTVSPPLTISHVFDNFNDQRNVTYDLSISGGTLTQNVGNPGADAVNGSNSVGQYVRNSSEQYDALFMSSADLGNANDYVFGRKVFFMDLYTDAPVGTKVTVQVENAAQSNNNPFPAGRHSAYDAFTTVQNGWQRLEFEWAASPDAAATGIFNVDQVVVLFDSGNLSGNTYYFDNFEVGSQPTPAVISTEVVEDYDGTSNWSYSTSSGTYNGAAANPGADATNSSATVAHYVRNSSEQYDTLVYNNFNGVEDASLFVDGHSKILVDLYTTAAVGTNVSFNLENSTIAATPYPAGRHSIYQAKTTVQNQWETVTFEYAYKPDAATPDTGIDQLIFLFDSGNYTGETFYIDNVRIINTKEPPTYQDNTVYENFDGTSLLTVGYYDGTYSAPIANPDTGGSNSSPNAGQYTRDAATEWDTLFFDTTAIAATAFEAETQVFAMDVYTSAPVGTPITWQLEDGNLTTTTNFPTGRRSSYSGTVGATNEWHTVRFKFNAVLDGSTSPTNINQMVLLFNGGSYTGDTFTFDNLRSQDVIEGGGGTPPTPVLLSQGKPAFSSSNENGALTPNLAVDGDTGTRWASGWSDNEWIYVDLQSDADVSRVVLNWEAAYASQYEVQVSSDATNWTTVHTENVGDGGIDDVTFTTTTARYVRVLGVSRATVYGYSLWELEVFGIAGAAIPTNVALAKPAFSSSNENAGTLPANAFDGNVATRWSSQFSDPQWIYVDLEAVYNISSVRLIWETAASANYQIQVSNDAVNWTTVHTDTNGNGGTDDIALSTSARYVRMYSTARTTAWGHSLWEFEVIGTP